MAGLNNEEVWGRGQPGRVFSAGDRGRVDLGPASTPVHLKTWRRGLMTAVSNIIDRAPEVLRSHDSQSAVVTPQATTGADLVLRVWLPSPQASHPRGPPDLTFFECGILPTRSLPRFNEICARGVPFSYLWPFLYLIIHPSQVKAEGRSRRKPFLEDEHIHSAERGIKFYFFIDPAQ